MTDTSSTPDTLPIRLVALTKNEWEVVDFYRRMSDYSRVSMLRTGHALAAADGGFDYQRSALERVGFVPLQEDLGTLEQLRLLPEAERKSAIQWLRDLLARAEQEAA